MHSLLTQSAIALGVMAVASVALGWLIAGRALRPLRTITTTTRQISASNLHQRLDLDGPDDELKELGDTIDDLLVRLDGSFDAQRQFVANASHELRSPLARQRTLAQVALDDPDATAATLRAAHERVLAAGVQQERLIDALLTLARGQAGTDRATGLDLAEITATVLRDRYARAEHHQVDVHTDLDGAPIVGDGQLVEQLVANLIDNALRYNHAGGQVRVITSNRDDGAVLRVVNTGPVVPPDAVHLLFQPFRRLGAGRTRHGDGNGLGLSIVKAIADTHHADITADASPDGGLDVTVAFPRDDHEPPPGRAPTPRPAPAYREAAGATAPVEPTPPSQVPLRP